MGARRVKAHVKLEADEVRAAADRRRTPGRPPAAVSSACIGRIAALGQRTSEPSNGPWLTGGLGRRRLCLRSRRGGARSILQLSPVGGAAGTLGVPRCTLVGAFRPEREKSQGVR